MADLRLQVIMTALDKITGPLKKIRGAAAPTSAAMKAVNDRLNDLNGQLKETRYLRHLQQDFRDTTVDLKKHRLAVTAAKDAYESQRAVQHSLASQTKTSRTEFKGLQRELLSTKDPSNQLTASFALARDSLTKLEHQYSTSQSKLRKLKTTFKEADASVTKLSASKTLLAEKLNVTRQRLEATGISTAKLRAHEQLLNTNLATTNTLLSTQQTKLAAVTRQHERMAKVRAQFNKTRDFAGNAAALGITSGAMGGGILMGAQRMLRPGVDFNAAMSRVQALSGLDKQSDAFTGLRDQSRNLGATTSYTATEAAQGQGYLAMAGFKPDEILQSMPTVLSMAKAGGSDLARTADIASDILTSFGLQSDQMARVGDVLTITFTTANTNLEMLGDTMKYVGPIAKAAGMSLEQASAMAGLLGNAGIKSSQAGTTLRSMLLRLAAPTSTAATALNELGIASRDLQGDVRDIPTILRDVADATKQLGSGKRLDYLKQIFGEEPAAGMAALIDKQGADGINRYVAIIENAKGVASKTATIMADNLQGDLQTLRSSWEDLGISASDAIDQPLRKITARIADILRGISKWMQDNPTLTATLLKVALTIGTMLAVLGTLTLALATVVVPMAAMKMALGVLGIKLGIVIPLLKGVGTALLFVGSAMKGAFVFLLTTPIGWTILTIVAALAALAGAAYLVVNNWTWIKGVLADTWAGIVTLFSGGIGAIAARIINWSPLGLFYKGFAGVLRWFGVDLPATFTGFGANIMRGLADGIVSGMKWALSAMATVADKVAGVFTRKTDIHSPSRLFARYGDYTMQGLAVGLQRSQDAPITQVSSLAKRLTQLGAGIAIGASMPAMAFDTRPPVAPRGASVQPAAAADNIAIHIHPAAGADPQAIAKAVSAELDRRDREKRARQRSSLHDY